MTGRFKSLTWKQTNLVVFTALFFAIAIFIVEIALVVVSTKQQLTTTQQELLDSVEQPAANAVWALDDNLARQTLEGAIKVEHVGSAVIELDDGSMFVSVSNNKQNNSQTFISLSNKLFDDSIKIHSNNYRNIIFHNNINFDDLSHHKSKLIFWELSIYFFLSLTSVGCVCVHFSVVDNR